MLAEICTVLCNCAQCYNGDAVFGWRGLAIHSSTHWIITTLLVWRLYVWIWWQLKRIMACRSLLRTFRNIYSGVLLRKWLTIFQKKSFVIDLWQGLRFVGNKAKGRFSKWVFQENKARQIFQKTNITYPLICTQTCVYQGVRNVRFSKNLTYFVFSKYLF